MLNFKQYLQETSSSKNSPEVARIRELVKEWRQELSSKYNETFGKFTLSSEGMIHTSDTLKIRDFMLDENGEFPFKIQSCHKLDVASDNLSSFKNFPDTITYYNNRSKDWAVRIRPMWKDNMMRITSLEGITPDAASYDLSMLKNVSFSKVNEHIKHTGLLAISPHYKGPLLSVFKIKYFQNFSTVHDIKWATTDCQKAQCIINKHLRTKNRDYISCQEELMDNGLGDYAKF